MWFIYFQGEKIFYLVEPTPENMDLYLQWMLKPNHHELFFGDMVRIVKYNHVTLQVRIDYVY